MTRAEMKAQRLARSAPDFATWMLDHYNTVLREHLQGRGNLTQEELEYTVEKVAQMKDARLASNIATLIGWGDDERATLETFCAVAIEVMRNTPPSRLREAARLVELRYLTKEL